MIARLLVALLLSSASSVALAQGQAPLMPVPNRAANDNSAAPANTRYVDTAGQALLKTIQGRAPLVTDTSGVKCDGTSDDRAALQAALDRAGSRQETVWLPPYRICAYSGTLTLNNARLHGSGTGAVLKPLSTVDTMISIAGSLSAVRDVQIVNDGNRATSAIVLATPEDALTVWIERNYVVGFSGDAVRREAGQHAVIRENTFLNNGRAYVQNSSGINDVIEGNYVAGGNGFLFRKQGSHGMEGAVVRGNIVFATGNPAWTALTVEAAVDMVVEANTFESDCNTVVYDGSNFAVSYIKSRSNWIGTQKPVAGKECYALTLKNQANWVTSETDVIIGRGQRGVLATADSAARSNLVPMFRGMRFYGATPQARASQDMAISYTLGTVIRDVDFTGAASLVEGPGVSGRVDGSLWGTLPNTIDAGLRYGDQAGGMTLRAKGSVGYPSGTTSQTIAHGLSYPAGPADFTFTAASHATNPVGMPVVVNVTPTSVGATLRGDPGSSGVAFGWSVDRTR